LKKKTIKGDRFYTGHLCRKRIIAALVLLTLAVFVSAYGKSTLSSSYGIYLLALGILFALPAAKFIVGVIVTLPSRPITDKQYSDINNALKDKESVKTYINAVLTSRDHVMTAECIVINSVSCAVLVTRQRNNDVPVSEKSRKKNDQMADYIKSFLDDEIKKRMSDVKLVIYKDEKAFIAHCLRLENSRPQKDFAEFINSVIV
jgi:hypothetical protein